MTNCEALCCQNDECIGYDFDSQGCVTLEYSGEPEDNDQILVAGAVCASVCGDLDLDDSAPWCYTTYDDDGPWGYCACQVYTHMAVPNCWLSATPIAQVPLTSHIGRTACELQPSSPHAPPFCLPPPLPSRPALPLPLLHARNGLVTLTARAASRSYLLTRGERWPKL